ncbi:MAG: choice-of-anchor L domain-containing protein, partial [Ferruginibacter sp.]
MATAYFNNESGSKLGLDSGIVLTNGRAKTFNTSFGLDGNGTSTASTIVASTNNQMLGDADLAREIGVPVTETKDATILEFDFVPLGDSIKFKYVFSSEEYTPSFVCSFNDAFAFFISGPGITGGVRNIALIPNTNTPVSIFNVNDVPGGGCPNNRAYYIDNANNKFFTHDGHTTILTALEKVIPCQTYHLKLVIADLSDAEFDSGVFLEAKSLSSNVISMHTSTQIDPMNNSYLVEGCAAGTIKIQRPNADNTSLDVHLSFAGTAI